MIQICFTQTSSALYSHSQQLPVPLIFLTHPTANLLYICHFKTLRQMQSSGIQPLEIVPFHLARSSYNN